MRLIWLLPCLCLSVLAHEVETAGNVSMEWHTTANEKLQAYADTTLEISFEVLKKPLDLEQCRCMLLLYKGKVSPRQRPQILKWTAKKNKLSSKITIEDEGLYTIVIDGKPKNAKDFTSFRFTLPFNAVEDVYSKSEKMP